MKTAPLRMCMLMLALAATALAQSGMQNENQQQPMDSQQTSTSSQQQGMSGAHHMGKMKMDEASVKSMIQSWPESAKAAAMEAWQKYGAPAEATETMLMWHDSGPFKHTIVTKMETQHDFPMPHKDVMEQVVSYKAPWDKFDELAASDGSVVAERTKGTLSARCDKVANNMISLNLANDVATGKKSVEEARKAHAEIAMKVKNGEKHEYAEKLMFDSRAMAGDPDKAVKMKDMEMSSK